MKKPLIIAHRGASELAPENTLAAFQRAIDDSADGIEFDVRLAKNGEVVVFHDSTLNRVGTINGRVIDFTAEELAQIDIGSWFNTRFPRQADENFSNERVSTLRQTLDFLKDFRGLIYIEIKCKDSEVKQIAEAVFELIKDSHLLPQIIVKSFQLEIIPTIKNHSKNIKTAALFAPKIMTLLRKEKRMVNIAEDLGADMLSIHFSLATRKLMKKAEKKNLPVTIWTANHERWVKRAINLGLYAVITNNPARLSAKLKEL
ncbi:MAG TPA: glycerophosphodiester phosphodiesterase family protein [Pyrinomonadaceae bacterium]|nr:glycerophosphodiester phosphodiesterase family protein [Pyrinomonadaceae bacterium]